MIVLSLYRSGAPSACKAREARDSPIEEALAPLAADGQGDAQGGIVMLWSPDKPLGLPRERPPPAAPTLKA